MRRRTNPRSAFTLTEMLLAAAVMSSVLLAVYALLQLGFRQGAGIQDRVQADAVLRNLVARISGLHRTELDALLADPAGVPLEVLAEELPGLAGLLPAGFDATLRLDPVAGAGEAAALSAEVIWKDSAGRLRRRSTLVPILPPSTATGKLANVSGFRKAAEVPGWGRARSWMGGPGNPDGRRLASVARAGADVARGPGDVPASGFSGDPAAVDALLGPGGRLAARRPGMPGAALVDPKRFTARFWRRVGGTPGEGLAAEEIPDGRYRMAAETLDLRNDREIGRIVGVLLLANSGGRYRMVADARYREDARYSFEGEPVIERMVVESEGAGWRGELYRTEERLYLVGRAGTSATQEVILRTLEHLDGSPTGTSRTMGVVEALLLEAGASLAREPRDTDTDVFRTSAGERGPGVQPAICIAGPGTRCAVKALRVEPRPTDP